MVEYYGKHYAWEERRAALGAAEVEDRGCQSLGAEGLG